MGTSQSSRGPGPRVPMIPPWVPDLPTPPSDDKEGKVDDGKKEGNKKGVSMPPKSVKSKEGRFANARSDLRSYAESGGGTRMRSAVKNYVRSGYGGSAIATARFGATAVVAGKLLAIISGEPTNDGAGRPVDRRLLDGKTPKQIIDTIIEVIRPVDGSQDSEVNRHSIKEALSELLKKDENTDLLNLTAEQKISVLLSYISGDIFRRFDLDIGGVVREKAGSIATAISRLKDVKDYIRETVAASFRRLPSPTNFTSSKIAEIVQRTLSNAFKVFEEYTL